MDTAPFVQGGVGNANSLANESVFEMAMIKWKGKWFSFSVNLPLMLLILVALIALLVPLVHVVRDLFGGAQ